MKSAQPQAELSTIDDEHKVQIGLIDLLTQSVESGEAGEKVLEILNQLIDYSEVHFLSEQLIMRHHSYEGFAEHDQQHADMMERLRAIRAQTDSGNMRLDTEAVKALRELLLQHIATQDRKLSRYLAA